MAIGLFMLYRIFGTLNIEDIYPRLPRYGPSGQERLSSLHF